MFLDRTPFYAEGGGQVGDQGVIRTATGTIRVTDTQPAGEHAIVHTGVVESGEVRRRPAGATRASTRRAARRRRAHTRRPTSSTAR